VRTAIIGSGAQGTILGVLATLRGEDVVLVDTNREHIDAMNANGATITGQMDYKNIRVKAVTPDKMTGLYDLVVLICKQTANSVAIPQAAKFIGPDSAVCTLQNGVPEEYVAGIIGAERTVGGTVMWGGEQREPGKVICTTGGEAYMKIDIGTLSGEYTKAARMTHEWLKCQGKVEFFPNFIGARWSKLWVNSGLSGMSAATGSTYDEICNNEKAVLCVAHIGNEVFRVGEALGIKLEKVMPLYECSELKFDDAKGRAHAVAKIRESHTQIGQRASMLVDMQKGRPCEIDYINGHVSDKGKQAGVPTPFCDTVVRIVREFEAGKRPLPTMACLDEFVIPDLRAF
jgi:2-dehydropantoate 2-reductase